MNLVQMMGIDLGGTAAAASLLAPAQELGVRVARVRFALGDRLAIDEAFLAEARALLEAAGRMGLEVIAVVDGDLTVAPGGAGAFSDEAPEEIAAAWADELRANAGRLVGAVAGRVMAWEVLPEANVGQPARISPGRWAALMAEVADGIRMADPRAVIVAGALLSDDVDDGVEYLHQAYRLGRERGVWPEGPPFDAIAARLHVLPEGGSGEDEVAAALTERTRRLWRVVENLEGTETAEGRGIFVTGVSWDSSRCGEDAQGRNAWTAFDALTADPVVRCVVWSGMVDGPGGCTGLYRGGNPSVADERPACRALRDFARYASQIGPEPKVLVALGAATGHPPLEASAPPVPDAASSPVATGAAAVPVAGALVEDGSTAEQGGRTVTFRIPNTAEVLRASGIAEPELGAVLAALAARYLDHEWLPPGEYRVTLPAPRANAPAVYTNQQVISALYRAGGGTWAVLDKSGLLLSDLAHRRDQPYSGPAIEDLASLSDDEVDRVLAALRDIAGP